MSTVHAHETAYVYDDAIYECGAKSSRSVLRLVPARSVTVPSGDVTEKALLVGVKLLVFLILMVVASIVGLLLGNVFAPQELVVVVQPGDSLYSIASDISDISSVDRTVDDIRSLNGLATDTLYVGQKLVLPER